MGKGKGMDAHSCLSLSLRTHLSLIHHPQESMSPHHVPGPSEATSSSTCTPVDFLGPGGLSLTVSARRPRPASGSSLAFPDTEPLFGAGQGWGASLSLRPAQQWPVPHASHSHPSPAVTFWASPMASGFFLPMASNSKLGDDSGV